MAFQGSGAGISGYSGQFAVAYANSAGTAGNASGATYASSSGAGTVRAWYSRTNSYGVGVNGMQFGNNNAYAFYNSSWGGYYLVMAGGLATGTWDSGYISKHDTYGGGGAYTNGVIVIG